MVNHLLSILFDLSRTKKRLTLYALDAFFILISFILAMLLRLDSLQFLNDPAIWWGPIILVPTTLAIFILRGLYQVVVRFLGLRVAFTILLGATISACVLEAAIYAFRLPIPRSVPAIYIPIAFLFIGGSRFVVRTLFLNRELHKKKQVVIYGAGEAGRQLLSSLREGPQYAPVAFIDDAPFLQGTVVNSVKVYAPDQLAWIINNFDADSILLAMPSIGRGRKASILKQLESYSLPIQTIPGIADLASGKARIHEILAVSIEDLLGRDPVPPSENLLDANIFGKTVLVTGAGGSIGGELCRQILRRGPEKLLLLDNSEFALYAIEQELSLTAGKDNVQTQIIALTGSVRDHERIETIFRRFDINTVYHAAAYKHVPLVEHNAVEGIRNNVFGTLEVAQTAIAAKVQAFILISTDKAVRPTNVMGATKRIAELICQALAQSQSSTCFSMVRFGNVLDSSGSVIPLFRRQISSGGPVTVTHAEINRYFMTIPEAAQLVVQAGAMAHGGEVFVLDMGEPVRIIDLARKMIRLSGFNPVLSADMPEGYTPETGDIEITITGLRPGEKLYEELLVDATASATDHPRIMKADEQFLSWEHLEPLLARLSRECATGDEAAVRNLLQEMPLSYHPMPEGRLFENNSSQI